MKAVDSGELGRGRQDVIVVRLDSTGTTPAAGGVVGWW